MTHLFQIRTTVVLFVMHNTSATFWGKVNLSFPLLLAPYGCLAAHGLFFSDPLLTCLLLLFKHLLAISFSHFLKHCWEVVGPPTFKGNMICKCCCLICLFLMVEEHPFIGSFNHQTCQTYGDMMGQYGPITSSVLDIFITPKVGAAMWAFHFCTRTCQGGARVTMVV